MSKNMRDRQCRECGVTFKGGPRAWYCPECRHERKKKSYIKYRKLKKEGLTREIGGIDQCESCKNDYVVESGMQRYCQDCRPIVYAKTDKEMSLEYYHKNKEVNNPIRNKRRREARKEGEEKYHKPIVEGKKERKKSDVIGQTYGKLTIKKEVEKKHNKRRFMCECECKNTKVVYLQNLKNGNTTSCGCIQAKKASDMALDLTGQKRGMLTAYKNTGKIKYGTYVWLFKCDCGCMTKMTTSEFGNIQSCGCLRNNKDQEIIEYNGYKWLASNVRVSREDFEDI